MTLYKNLARQERYGLRVINISKLIIIGVLKPMIELCNTH